MNFLSICLLRIDVCLHTRKSTDCVCMRTTKIDFTPKCRNKITVRGFKHFSQIFQLHFMGVHCRWRWLISDAFLERTTGIRCVSERLNNGIFCIGKYDVSITKNFDIKVILTELCVEVKTQDSVKTKLAHSSHSCIFQMFSQDHGKRRWCHRHWTVPIGSVNT